jgi:integrase
MPRNLPTPADRLIRSFVAARRNKWSHEYLYIAVGTLNRLHAFLAARGLTLVDADPADLNDFLAERLATGLHPSTVIGDHTKMRGFYKWASTDPGDGLPYVTPNPMLRVEAPKGAEPEPANIPEAEEWQYQALMATCTGRRTRAGERRALDRRDAAIIAVLWHVGIRRGELAAVDYDDIDWDSQMLHLGRTKGRTRARARDVYVPDEAMEYLERYVWERGEHPGALQRRRLAANSIHLMLGRRCDVANATQQLPEVLHVPSHSFRRGLAAAWLENGGQQVMLETHMGWKHDGRMAARYSGKSQTKLAAADAARVAEARAARRLRSVS